MSGGSDSRAVLGHLESLGCASAGRSAGKPEEASRDQNAPCGAASEPVSPRLWQTVSVLLMLLEHRLEMLKGNELLRITTLITDVWTFHPEEGLFS